jgi:hypothetical protein
LDKAADINTSLYLYMRFIKIVILFLLYLR